MSISLHCTHCDCEYLHHFRVEVCARAEDEDTVGVAIDAYTGEVEIPPKNTINNPSSRRNAVRTLLECEQCDGITALEIIQHKGDTFLKTRKYGSKVIANDPRSQTP